MTNTELVEKIQEMFGEDAPSIILEGDEYADGEVGISNDGQVIYDYEKLVAALSKAWDCTAEEAIEWIEFNPIRSIPYMKSYGPPPIIMYSFNE